MAAVQGRRRWRAALGGAALVVVALSVGLPAVAHAGTTGTAVLLDDKHSKDPGHGGGRPGPSQTPPTPSTPSPVPSDPAQSLTPGAPVPTGTEGDRGVPPPSDKASPPAPAPVPAGGVTPGPSIVPPGNDVGAPSPAMLGRQLAQSAPGTHAAVPALAPAFDPNDTVRIGGTAMPLWLIVGSGGLLVVLMAIGLVLTLRDRDRESDLDGLSILDAPDPPASVKFG